MRWGLAPRIEPVYGHAATLIGWIERAVDCATGAFQIGKTISYGIEKTVREDGVLSSLSARCAALSNVLPRIEQTRAALRTAFDPVEDEVAMHGLKLSRSRFIISASSVPDFLLQLVERCFGASATAPTTSDEQLQVVLERIVAFFGQGLVPELKQSLEQEAAQATGMARTESKDDDTPRRSAAEWARKLNKPLGMMRGRLERRRTLAADGDWEEVTDRRKGGPQYLYSRRLAEKVANDIDKTLQARERAKQLRLRRPEGPVGH